MPHPPAGERVRLTRSKRKKQEDEKRTVGTAAELRVALPIVLGAEAAAGFAAGLVASGKAARACGRKASAASPSKTRREKTHK